jgi:hypothetical protein
LELKENKNMSKMMNAAMKYAESGWAVFPLAVGSKIPMKGSGGVKDATTDTDLVATIWETDPYANIGLACGEASGVYVVDVDVNHKSGADGFKSLAEAGIELPPTLAARTPNGGVHCFYKWTRGEKPKTGSKVNGLLGVDVRADGGYVVVAPSKISGKAYAWENEAEIAEFPEALKPKAKAAKPVVVAAPVNVGPTRSEILERASMYLATCDGAIQGAGGHNTLLRVAAALTIGFNLSDSEATTLLWSEYNPRCIPPWDVNNRSDVRDFERKVTESRKNPRHPQGYLLEVENPVWDGAAELGEAFAAQLISGGEDENVEAVTPEIDSWEGEEDEEEEEKDDVSALPAEILDPPGLVGDIARWIIDTAPCYQPLFAVGAALTLCGALFGRKVKDEYDTRTNLYGLCIGQSSSGKDYPQKAIMRILAAAGEAAEKMIAKEVTSDAAIMSALGLYPVRLFVWDEVGHFFTNMKGGKDGSYMKTIRPMLLQLYSSANLDKFKGKQMASKEEAASVEFPHVCIWGATSPDILYSDMTKGEITDGFIGRFLTFVSPTRPLPVRRKISAVPDAISSRVAAWVTRVIPPPAGMAAFDAHLKQHQMVVPTTQAAGDALDEFRRECHAKMDAEDAKSDVTNNLWSKAAEIAGRVALTVACGRSFDNPEVAKSDVDYAVALVRHCVRTFSDSIRDNIAETPWEREKNKIVKILEKAGRKGMSLTEIANKTKGLRSRKERCEYLADLAESRLIVQGKNPKQPKALWYWHVDYAPKGVR